MIAYPTNTCFDDCVEIAAEYIDALDELVIVHAVIVPDGREMVHSWVERGDSVLTIVIIDGKRELLETDKAEYYEQAKIIESTRYTFQECLREEARTGHYAPWEPRYKGLCSP